MLDPSATTAAWANVLSRLPAANRQWWAEWLAGAGWADSAVRGQCRGWIWPSALLGTEWLGSVAERVIIEGLKRQPEAVFRLSSRQLELLVAALLRDRGFDVRLTPATHDGGKDLLAYLDTGLSRMLCLVETKHYRADRPVGVDAVRQLYGTMNDHRASQAVLVTTSSFTRHAREFAERHAHQISLHDRATLSQWIAEYPRLSRRSLRPSPLP